jgi:threonine aldolase
MLVGDRAFIDEARKVRKALGGGMRQVGILAAAALIALEKHPARLHEDHENARFLAEGMARIPGIAIDPSRVSTNILIFDISATCMNSSEFSRGLAEQNVLANGINAKTMRFVTHMGVDRAACECALRVVENLCATSPLQG